jgi:hypothetical protein
MTTGFVMLAQDLLGLAGTSRKFTAELGSDQEMEGVAHELELLGCQVTQDSMRCMVVVNGGPKPVSRTTETKRRRLLPPKGTTESQGENLMKNNESKLSCTDPQDQQNLKTLDPARFEGIADGTASCSQLSERSEGAGASPEAEWSGGGFERCSKDRPELVASAWRVLNEPYVFPHEAEYRAAAEKGGCEVTSLVQSEDGGYRHELVLESGTPEADPSGKGTLE